MAVERKDLNDTWWKAHMPKGWAFTGVSAQLRTYTESLGKLQKLGINPTMKIDFFNGNAKALHSLAGFKEGEKLANAGMHAVTEASRLVSEQIKKTKLKPDTAESKLMYEFMNALSKEKGQLLDLESVLKKNEATANAAAAAPRK